MTSDLTDQLQRIIEWISGLGFVLPFAIFLVVQMFNRNRKDPEPRERPADTRPAEQPTPAPDLPPGMPLGLPGWLGMEQPAQPPTPPPPTTAEPADQWGHSFDRQPSVSSWDRQDTWGRGFDEQPEERDVLRWGSTFESDSDGEPIRWTSVFDEESQQQVYGWDGIQWGGAFPPRDSEPVVHFG